MPFNIVDLILNFVIIALLCVLFLYLHYYGREEMDLDPVLDKLFQKIQASDAGVSSGRARNIKKLDNLLAQEIMKQYPILEQISTRWPGVGEHLLKNPDLLFVLQDRLVNIATKLGKDNLPPEVLPIVEALIGFSLQKPG